MKLSKRILSTYIILYNVFMNREFNIGEALDILEYFSSKRTAIKDIKRLWKMGFLRKIKRNIYCSVKPEEALRNYLLKYIVSRIKRQLKTKHVEGKVSIVDDKIIVRIKETKITLLENPLIAFQELQ